MAAVFRAVLRSRLVLVRRKTVKPLLVGGYRLYSEKIIDPPQLGPSIPNYKVREDETTEMKRARLLYQSRKRGMLENGLLLSTFADRHLDEFDDDLLQQYDYLINQPTNDWDLYYWITENKPTPDEYNSPVMDMIKDFAKNEDRDVRTRQPDLKQEEQEERVL